VGVAVFILRPLPPQAQVQPVLVAVMQALRLGQLDLSARQILAVAAVQASCLIPARSMEARVDLVW